MPIFKHLYNGVNAIIAHILELSSEQYPPISALTRSDHPNYVSGPLHRKMFTSVHQAVGNGAGQLGSIKLGLQVSWRSIKSVLTLVVRVCHLNSFEYCFLAYRLMVAGSLLIDVNQNFKSRLVDEEV